MRATANAPPRGLVDEAANVFCAIVCEFAFDTSRCVSLIELSDYINQVNLVLAVVIEIVQCGRNADFGRFARRARQARRWRVQRRV